MGLWDKLDAPWAYYLNQGFSESGKIPPSLPIRESFHPLCNWVIHMRLINAHENVTDANEQQPSRTP